MWSPDGVHIAAPDSSGRLVIWDPGNAQPTQVLEVGRPISAVSWSPDGATVAIGIDDPEASVGDSRWSDDFSEWDEGRVAEDDALRAAGFASGAGGLTVRLLDVASGLQVAALPAGDQKYAPDELAWGPTADVLNVASGHLVEQWHPYSGHLRGTVSNGSELQIGAVAVNTVTGRVAALGGDAVVIWSLRDGERQVKGSSGSGVCLAFSPSGGTIVAGLVTGSIEVWSLDDHEPSDLRLLDGHASAVTGVSVSADGRLLASRGRDGSICLWDTGSWELLAEHDVGSGRSETPQIAFGPRGHLLATTAGDDVELHVFDLDVATFVARRHAPGTVHYANAKVVLLGDASVGKSGLGLVLAGRPFQPTDSTHQRNVYRLSVTTANEVDPPERREVFLWDLAGQPGYRLLHQLHMRDVAVAAVVFDAQNDLDPLGGVRYWGRALRQAEVHGNDPVRVPTHRILVAARMDRGRARVSDAELDETRRTFEFDDYVTTSAKEGTGIAGLRRIIDDSIDWAAITKISSTGLFDSIRAFLLEKRESDVLLARTPDLQAQFVATGIDVPPDIDAEFRSSIERAEARGQLRRLSFGDFVLLRPEVLDAYAAAVVNAAAQDVNGLGAISEDEVRNGKFFVPSDLRIGDRATEQLLLLATVEDLLGYEIALREDSDRGVFLVFPTENSRQVELPVNYRPWCDFRFDGPTAHIWATLIVRLTHSGLFTPLVVAGNAALLATGGQRFAITRETPDQGQGHLQLLRHTLASPDVEPVLESFVANHLARRAARGTILQSAVVACRECRFVVPEAVLELLPDQRVIRCPRCGEGVERSGDSARTTGRNPQIRGLNAAADRERERLMDRVTADGKAAVQDFDVFLAHNSVDVSDIVQLDSRLRDNGISTWRYADQIPPGRWFQDVLQEAIGKVRSAAIVVGPTGLGRWERLELRSFVSRCVKEGLPVIPVLLPGASWPIDVPFLEELNGVVFEHSVEDDDAFANLVWGITGDRHLRDRLLQAGRLRVRAQKPS
jgi:WD40 repeat protein